MTKFQLSFICAAVLAPFSAFGQAFLFQDATIATWSDDAQGVQVLPNSALLVNDSRIQRIYTADEVTPLEDPDITVINSTNKIIVPGFINTHQHVWQAIYKALGPNVTFASYVPSFSEFGALSYTLSPDEVRVSQLMGCLELLNEGTTSWIDNGGASWSNESTDAMVEGTVESGGRGFIGPAVHSVPNYPISEQIAKLRSLGPLLQNNSLVTLGLAYDGFNTNVSTPEVRSALLELISDTPGLEFITTHFVGGPFGLYNSPEHMHTVWDLLNGSLPLIFGHASYLTPLDASLLRQTNQYVSVTPESELHFGHGNPELHRIQDQSSLGADTQFTFSTSLVTQARLWLQTLRGRLFQQQVDNWIVSSNSPMSTNQAFYLATRAGALALRRPDLGIIAVNATADLVMYDMSGVHMLATWRDPVAGIMLHSNPGDLTDVMVGGQFVKRNGTLTYSRWEELRQEFETRAREIGQRWQDLEAGIGEPRVFELGEYGTALPVDAVRGNATGY